MSEKFAEAIRRFDAANRCDPNQVEVDGQSVAQEELSARRLTAWVERLCPTPSEALLLAARCQHLCRWEIPRASYEKNRAGYLRWRADLREMHARKSAEILRAVGYDDALVTRVQELNRKATLGHDPECQTLEDALCLVTLQFQLDDLLAKTEPDTLVSILQKTWKKMSPQAREEASALTYSDPVEALLARALG